MPGDTEHEALGRDEQQVKKMISAASSLCSMTFEAGDADALYACRMLLKGLLPHVGDHETAAAKPRRARGADR